MRKMTQIEDLLWKISSGQKKIDQNKEDLSHKQVQ